MKLLTRIAVFLFEIEEEGNKEVASIHEYLFAEKEVGEVQRILTNQQKLLSERICIVGGSPAWQNDLKGRFPKWKFLDKSALNFDKKIFQNVDHVYINTFRLSHPFYYKVTSALRNRNIQMHFVKNTNIGLFLRQISVDMKNIR